jgi:hypothetical protein
MVELKPPVSSETVWKKEAGFGISGAESLVSGGKYRRDESVVEAAARSFLVVRRVSVPHKHV